MMQLIQQPHPTSAAPQPEHPERPARAPYTAPRLERLGEWSELTMLYVQSVKAGEGDF